MDMKLAAEDVAAARYALLSAFARAGAAERAMKNGERPSLEPVRDRVIEAREVLDRANRRLGYAAELPPRVQ